MEVDINAQEKTKDTNVEIDAVRERSQTDHLNKKLLEAFLSRINNTINDGQAVLSTTNDSDESKTT